jgi:hypothetical protein
LRIIQQGKLNVVGNFTAGKAAGSFTVYEKRIGDVWIEILVDNRSGPIWLRDFTSEVDGGFDDLSDAEDTPRTIFITPSGKHLVIGKHLDSTTNITNVYRLDHRTAHPIRIGGARFDEACGRHYCDRRGIDMRTVTGAGRDCFLESWHGPSSAVFDISSSNGGYQRENGSHSIFFEVVFDFQRERFVHLSDVAPWRPKRR